MALTEAGRRERSVELVAVVVMSLTAILTAWTGFQSSKWSGVMSINFNMAGASRTESVRQANIAGQQLNLDVGVFLAWIEAVAEEDDLRADFLFDRFPERLRVATEPWVALEPLNNPEAPATPFEMDAYVIEARVEADRLERAAEEFSNEARRSNQRSDNYVITTILFATVLFFAALSNKLAHQRNRQILLGFAVIMLFVGVAIVLSYPIEI